MIAGGGSHSLALRSDGTVWAWGGNDYGQLGDGTTTQRQKPMQISGLVGVTAISCNHASDHSLALLNNGTVWAWGYNEWGQLGDGTTTNRLKPVPVLDLSDVTAIAAGGFYSLALKNDGTVWAWGNGGMLGDGTSTSRNRPVQVSSLSDVTAIAGGIFHSLALKSDGTIWAWGANDSGQLGDGTNINRLTPIPVLSLSNVIAIAGAEHSLALLSNGTVRAWGNNFNGQLGDGTTTNRNAPVAVSGMNGVKAIATGNSYSIWLKSNGTVWVQGRNTDGELPKQLMEAGGVNALSDITAIAGGYRHSLALKSNGTVWAWGANDSDQLGVALSGGGNWSEPVQVGSEFNVDVGGSDNTNAAAPVIFLQPEDITANIGDKVTLRVSISAMNGMTLSYQWYSNAINSTTGGAPIKDANSPTYLPPTGGSVVMYYYCVITNTDNTATGNKTAQVTSRAAKVTVKSSLPNKDDSLAVDFYVRNAVAGKKHINMDIKWSDDFFNKSASEYSTDLAIASLVLAEATYDYEVSDGTGKGRIRDALEVFGFSCDKTDRFSTTNPWQVAYAFGHKKIGNTTVVAVIIRGTPPGFFNVENIFGNLKALFDGFESERVIVRKALREYIKTYLGAPSNIKFLIAGHSRGAAVANMLGVDMSDEYKNKNNVFTYCFATPNTTLANKKTRESYTNIHSWTNNDDNVCFVPFFYKIYGMNYKFTPQHWPEIATNYSMLTSGNKYSSFNIFGGSPHAPETYMAALLAKKVFTVDENRLLISIKCPVDVEVYNSSGVLIGRVVGNKLDESISQGLLISIVDDEKYFLLPGEDDYTFKMVGTDNGKMTYTIEYADSDELDPSSQNEYKNVILTPGKTMTSTAGDTITTSDVHLLVTNKDGTPIATVNTDGTETNLKQFFKLWGKVTRWEKTPLNWFLLIICFGWIWMHFI